MKRAIVLGAGGFIGSHLVKRLKEDGFWVRGIDLKYPEFSESQADDFVLGDLRNYSIVEKGFELPKGECLEEVYQLAADMGSAGCVFTGENDADILHNSALINLHVLDLLKKQRSGSHRQASRVFYSSSACMYPSHNQEDPLNPNCREDSAYPANPDSEYGWEKLFSERLYLAFNRNYSIPVRVARYHNIFGPEGTWKDGREKAPAAICRKIAEAQEGGEIEIWGDGNQTRSFLYIDECIDATVRMMRNPDFIGPINIGSEEMVSINQLVEITSQVAKKKVKVKHILGPQGVRGRNSSNDLIREKLNWDYEMTLSEGISKTYNWILSQVEISRPSSKQ